MHTYYRSSTWFHIHRVFYMKTVMTLRTKFCYDTHHSNTVTNAYKINKFTSYIWLEHNCHTDQCRNDVYRLNKKHKPRIIFYVDKYTYLQVVAIF